MDSIARFAQEASETAAAAAMTAADAVNEAACSLRTEIFAYNMNASTLVSHPERCSYDLASAIAHGNDNDRMLRSAISAIPPGQERKTVEQTNRVLAALMPNCRLEMSVDGKSITVHDPELPDYKVDLKTGKKLDLQLSRLEETFVGAKAVLEGDSIELGAAFRRHFIHSKAHPSQLVENINKELEGTSLSLRLSKDGKRVIVEDKADRSRSFEVAISTGETGKCGHLDGLELANLVRQALVNGKRDELTHLDRAIESVQALPMEEKMMAILTANRQLANTPYQIQIVEGGVVKLLQEVPASQRREFPTPRQLHAPDAHQLPRIDEAPQMPERQQPQQAVREPHPVNESSEQPQPQAKREQQEPQAQFEAESHPAQADTFTSLQLLRSMEFYHRAIDEMNDLVGNEREILLKILTGFIAGDEETINAAVNCLDSPESRLSCLRAFDRLLKKCGIKYTPASTFSEVRNELIANALTPPTSTLPTETMPEDDRKEQQTAETVREEEGAEADKAEETLAAMDASARSTAETLALTIKQALEDGNEYVICSILRLASSLSKKYTQEKFVQLDGGDKSLKQALESRGFEEAARLLEE